jgi:hypothetical protein
MIALPIDESNLDDDLQRAVGVARKIAHKLAELSVAFSKGKIPAAEMSRALEHIGRCDGNELSAIILNASYDFGAKGERS